MYKIKRFPDRTTPGKNNFLLRLPFIEKLNINKRQKFIIAVLFLSSGLFFSENLFGRSSFLSAFLFAFLTNIFLICTNFSDLNKKTLPVFIFPFFFSLSFGLFHFLIPSRFLTRLIITVVYSIGLYSVFLSQNIFSVASIRTIALLSSARTVSFIITLLSFFFLLNVVFSLDLSLIFTSLIIFIITFFLTIHSIWTYSLDKPLSWHLFWDFALALTIGELSAVLWFWPSSPTIISLFLTGFFYTIVGISHAWLEKRLFKGVLWEYVWVGVIIFCILILFTSWSG